MTVATEPEIPTRQVASDEKQQAAQEPATSVWLLTNAPSPYQSELLSAIADRNDIDLDVRFMLAGSPAGRAAARRFPFRVMRSVMPGFLREELQLHPRAIMECAFSRRECFVLSGLYTSITFLLCAFVLTLRRVPWIVWFERPHPERDEDVNWSLRLIVSRPARAIRRLVQTTILRSASRVMCIGTAAKNAYAALGVPEHRLDVLPYCCDLDRYADVVLSSIEAIRDRHQLDGQAVFLFSGQMIDRKGVDTVIEAFKQVADRCPHVSLVLLGDGPLRDQYAASVPEPIRSRVHFPGHVPQADIPAYFLTADVFVFPSRHDGWGVVINEACAAQLPVITTHQTGASVDLVEEGRSGYVLERDDVNGFARAMRHLIDHPKDRQAWGQRSRQLVEEFSPDNGAIRFQRAVTAGRNP